MKKKDNPADTVILTKEKKDRVIQAVITHFRNERDEDIGELAAELVADAVLKEIGPAVYNQALRDVRVWFADRLDNLESDFLLLEKK